MTTYRRKGKPKWKRPATDFPDRAHSAGVAQGVRERMAEMKAKDDAWYEQLLKESGEEDQRTED